MYMSNLACESGYFFYSALEITVFDRRRSNLEWITLSYGSGHRRVMLTDFQKVMCLPSWHIFVLIACTLGMYIRVGGIYSRMYSNVSMSSGTNNNIP